MAMAMRANGSPRFYRASLGILWEDNEGRAQNWQTAYASYAWCAVYLYGECMAKNVPVDNISAAKYHGKNVTRRRHNKAATRVRREDVISLIDDRLFSTFVEHMGWVVYTGIYGPGYLVVDAGGFWEDVAALIRPLDLPLFRYPGATSSPATGWKTGSAPGRSVPSCETWPGWPWSPIRRASTSSLTSAKRWAWRRRWR